MHRALILIALAVAAPTAFADVYRWVDAQGEVHYSDRPVEGAELVKATNPRPTRVNDDDGPARPSPRVQTAAVNPGTPSLSEERDNQRAVQADVASAREKQCKEAKDRYQRSIQASRIYRTNDAGEREFLSPAEADQLRLSNREAMNLACAPPSG